MSLSSRHEQKSFFLYQQHQYPSFCAHNKEAIYLYTFSNNWNDLFMSPVKGFCAIKPERLCSDGFSWKFRRKSTPKDTFVGFWRSEWKGHVRRGLEWASLLKTRTLWGIFFAQMSSLIQRGTGPIWRSKVMVLLVLCSVHRNALKFLYLNANINPRMMFKGLSKHPFWLNKVI